MLHSYHDMKSVCCFQCIRMYVFFKLMFYSATHYEKSTTEKRMCTSRGLCCMEKKVAVSYIHSLSRIKGLKVDCVPEKMKMHLLQN